MKQKWCRRSLTSGAEFSAVICCGLIEAADTNASIASRVGFSAVICCGLIEASLADEILDVRADVFRSDMLRPH